MFYIFLKCKQIRINFSTKKKMLKKFLIKETLFKIHLKEKN